MSPPEAKLSGDFTETETLKSILSHGGDSAADAATGWHPKEGKQRSEDIDRYLEAESAKLQRQFKVLVLGMIEPKDMFWKQTSLLEKPLTDNDREEMKSTIQKRVLQVARGAALELSDELKKGDGLETSKQEAAEMLQQVLKYDEKDLDFGRKLDELYQDPAFQNHIDLAKLSMRDTERKYLEIQYSMFLDSSNNTDLPLTNLLRRVLSKDYKPTDSDYIHFDNRRKLSYLCEAQIHRDTHLLRILDLHSGRGERKKWIHFFEDTKAVIFVVDLGAYCQQLMEDGGYSMLYESLLLFESVARSRWFLETPVVCVLSNVGAFRRKLKDNPLSKWFSDYQGETEEDAVQFMVDRHVNAVSGRQGVEVQVCDELSPSAVQNVIENMEKTALKDVLQELGVTGEKVG